MTAPDPLKLARDALADALRDLLANDGTRRSIPAVNSAIAAIDAMPASVQAVAWHMRVIGCDGSADWLEMGAGHPETPPGIEALPLVYAPASVPSGEPAAKKPHGCEHHNGQFCGKAGPCLYPHCAPTAPAAPAPAAVPASEPNESLVIGQAQQLIGALIAHRLLHKSMCEPDYINLWDVVKRHLRLVNKEGARTMSAAPAVAAPEPQPAEAPGLPISQEPKYTTNGAAIINRASGEAIPADEPVFIFRARDVYAREGIEAYACVLTPGPHRDAVVGRVADFARFAAQHPERMKEPDTAPTTQEQR